MNLAVNSRLRARFKYLHRPKRDKRTCHDYNNNSVKNEYLSLSLSPSLSPMRGKIVFDKLGQTQRIGAETWSASTAIRPSRVRAAVREYVAGADDIERVLVDRVARCTHRVQRQRLDRPAVAVDLQSVSVTRRPRYAIDYPDPGR